MLTPKDIGLPAHLESFRYDKESGTDQFNIAYDIAASKKRIIILGAPPGTGKTVINFAAGLLAAKSSYRILYLVSTNPLLRQVEDEFKSIGVSPIIGMGNYACNEARDTWTRRQIMCNEGICLSGFSCDLRNGGCDYYDAVRTAHDSRIVLSNFAYRASVAKYSDPNNIGKFDLVVCDEAHLLFDWLTGFCTIKLDRREVSKLLKVDLPGNSSGLPVYCQWARDNIPLAEQLYRDRRAATPTDNRQLNSIKQLGHDMRSISQIDASDSLSWVVEPWRYGVEITPVEPGQFLERYIYLGAEKIILSSASVTEVDAPLFGCSNTTSNTYEFIQGGSGFPVKHRPLIWVPTCDVKHNMSPESKRYWMLQIDSLCELGSDYRGIIHTVSYPRMRYIYDSSQHSHRMIIHRSSSARDRSLPTLDKALELFFETPNSILVSPVVGTGHDFKYARAHWQVICKTPFVNPKSPIVEARKKLWKSKYNLDYLTVTAAKTIVQMYGRTTRAGNDWSWTFVIDNSWGRYVGKSPAIPAYVKDSMSTCWDGLPGKVEPLC